MAEHGTTTLYARGCRCDACRAAATAYQREYKAAKAAGTWQPKPKPTPAQCSGPGCDRPARYKKPQALCGPHYNQLVTRGVELSPLGRHRRVSDGAKECSRCAVVKPTTDFPHAKGKIAGPCKACLSIINRMRLYGLTFDETVALMANPCAGCGSTERLHVDHCHDTGRVRGVLCHNCNAVLTKHMTPEVLRRLAQYLEA